METWTKLIPAGTKLQNNKQQPQPAINLIKVNNRNTVARSEMCSKLTIKRPERRQQYLYF